MFSNILVPLDGSATAEAALVPAKFIARASGGEIKLVRGIELPPGHLAPLDWDELSPPLKAEDERCQAYLEQLALKLRDEGFRVRTEVMDYGPPAERILEVVDDDEIDLVILTSHGRTGVTRFLVGSVAEKVARYAHCPVMMVGRRSNIVAEARSA